MLGIPCDQLLDMCQRTIQRSASEVFDCLEKELKPQVYIVAVPVDLDRAESVHLIPTDDVFSADEVKNAILKLKESAGFPMRGAGPSSELESRLWAVAVRHKVRDTIEASSRGFAWFVEPAVQVHSCTVYSVLGLKKRVFDSHYSLARWEGTTRSLLDGVTKAFLDQTGEAINKLLSEEPLRAIDRIRDFDVLRRAGERLMCTPGWVIWKTSRDGIQDVQEFPRRMRNLFSDCNVISGLRYEGAESSGWILLSQRNHPNVEAKVEFALPVSLGNYRGIRKLLEITKPIEIGTGQLYLLCDSVCVYGIGEIEGSYDPRNEDLFRIEFTSHYSWKLWHEKNEMMIVSYERPRLPRKKKPIKDEFEERIRQAFTKIDAGSIEDLWQLIEAATQQRHGTMVVISDHAEQEARRLASRSTKLSPIRLTPDLMRQMTAIDGAVLIGPDSQCHAMGVILDGLVEEGKGDPSRGARYNSAITYLDYAEKMSFVSFIVVVSEDGMVNLFPET